MKSVVFALVGAVIALGTASVANAQSLDQAVALFNAKRYSEAKVALQPFGDRDASAAFYLGQLEMMDDQDDKAADWFEKAVHMNPKNSTYYEWLGRAYGRQAQHANKFRLPFLARKTKNAWDTSLALDPENLDVREDLIAYYTQAPRFLGGSKDKAREMALEVGRRNAYRGSIDIANLCGTEKDSACVERELQNMMSAYPDSALPVVSLAAYYANVKDYAKSFDLLDARLRGHPNELVTLFQLGRTASLSGQNLDRGERALRAYLSSPPADHAPSPAIAHYRLGLIYEKKGQKDLARREYQTALQLNPKLDDAKKALDALE